MNTALYDKKSEKLVTVLVIGSTEQGATEDVVRKRLEVLLAGVVRDTTDLE